MVVLVDTTGLPLAERAEAFDSALNSAVFPSRVELDCDVEEPYARVELWVLGAGVDVVQATSNGHRMSRTYAQIRAAAPERLSLAMPSMGAIDVEQGIRSYHSLHSVYPMDATSPFRATFTASDSKPSLSMCAQVDLKSLGMPVDVVRAALPRLPASPVYGLFRSHLAGLASVAASIEDTPAAMLLGSATSELARALLASAAADDQRARDSLAAVLFARIDAYIERNLTDVGLVPDRIALEHSISVRYLYRLFAERGISLEQRIISGRLELARRELTHLTGTRRSIEAIAHRAGFTHAQHFSRRFREAFGMPPREWQRIHTSTMARDRAS